MTSVARAALWLCLLLAGRLAAATDITVVNVDPPFAGFNDPTPATPVGGNTGTTIGQQRLKAFEFAAALWGNIILGERQIRVRASFTSLSCDANSAVLGAAGPDNIHANFANAPLADTWYVGALANEYAGVDLADGDQEIRASFNGNIDNNDACLNNRNWYYGLDNAAPGNDIDFLNVLMHELGHGLGFFSTTDLASGALPSNRPDIFSRLAFDNEQGLFLAQMSNAQRLAATTATGSLVFTGQHTQTRAAALLSSGVDSNGFVRLYAPSAVQPGSSVAHFDTVASPNVLMEPNLTGTLTTRTNVDLTPSFMADIGWPIADADVDFVTDLNDNCVIVPNLLQLDADGDGYGNRCDADLNNDQVVNVQDLGLLKQLFFTAAPIADLNEDGIVNSADLGILKVRFLRAPGPTGILFP